MTPPKSNELEISLFGPGVGECVVLHLGNNEWFVLDSCVNRKSKNAIALDYLDKLNVKVATQVKFVLATHWHDDHIGGISQLLRAANSADFGCSSAMDCDEFFKLLAAGQEAKLVEADSGASEIRQVFEILNSRAYAKHAAGPHHWVQTNMCLYNDPHHTGVHVHALSPSAQTITDTRGKLAAYLPKELQPIRKFHSSGPNDHSVVLLVSTPRCCILLGSDLEHTTDDRRGWKALISSRARPQVQGDVYKVAHHGSENADCEGIWGDLLAASPIAVLAPYGTGKKPLPSDADVKRLKKRAGKVYSTVWPPTVKPKKRAKAVDRTAGEIVGENRRAVRDVPGHIRIRIPIGSDITAHTIDLIDGAEQIK